MSKMIRKVILSVCVGIMIMSNLTTVFANSLEVDLGRALPYGILGNSKVQFYGTNTVEGNMGGIGTYSVYILEPSYFTGKNESDNKLLSAVRDDVETLVNNTKNYSKYVSVSGNLGAQVFKQGIYKSDTSVSINGDLILDAEGNRSATFIFVVRDLNIAKNARINLLDKANAANIYFIVEQSVKIESDTELYGNIIAENDINVSDRMKLNGRLISTEGAVVIYNSSIVAPNYEKAPPVEIQKNVIKLFIGKKSIELNGKVQEIDSAPFIKEGRTFVPMSLVTRLLGGEVTYTKNIKGATDKLYLTIGNYRVNMQVNNKEIRAEKHGLVEVYQADVAPFVSEGRTMIPFKLLGDIIDAKVTYGMNKDNTAVEWVQYTY